LTIERDDGEIITVEEGEHVSRHVKYQHAFSALKLLERQFFFYICAQRQAIFTIVFYVHGL
jgi:hypothetical protein